MQRVVFLALSSHFLNVYLLHFAFSTKVCCRQLAMICRIKLIYVRVQLFLRTYKMPPMEHRLSRVKGDRVTRAEFRSNTLVTDIIWRPITGQRMCQHDCRQISQLARDLANVIISDYDLFAIWIMELLQSERSICTQFEQSAHYLELITLQVLVLDMLCWDLPDWQLHRLRLSQIWRESLVFPYHSFASKVLSVIFGLIHDS